MADAAVGFLLENLTQLMRSNADLFADQRNPVEGLLLDLQMLKSFTIEFRHKRTKNPILQELVRNIRIVVQKAEDIIDAFVLETSKFNRKNGFQKTIHLVDHTNKIRTIRKDIKSIRREVSMIFEKHQYGFQSLQFEESPERVTGRKPIVAEYDDVVGFDEQAKTIISRLTGDNRDLDIITIVGMTGLGKTTLARKIYFDTHIEYEFFTRAWVYVSQEYSRKDIFLSILSRLTYTNDFEDKSEEVIVSELSTSLAKGKYLIVLDDVWTEETWDDLKNAFPRNNYGSRILITSRHKYVAHKANPNMEPHDLRFLTQEESWELLEKKVFGMEKCQHGKLQALGKEIAMQCQGLPLSIVVISGVILNNRDSVRWWEQVASNVNSLINDQSENIQGLSYDHLPYHLKSCFLYVGVFPEQFEIPIQKLIWLWIAEGFIEQNMGRASLEEMGEAYLEELVSRNLLFAVQRRSNGRIKTCRVSSITREFCIKEARKQNFYQEINDMDLVTLDRYRRVCIHSQVLEFISLKPVGEHIRSFLSFLRHEIVLQKNHMSMLFKAFKLLRVLDVTSITLEFFPKDLLQLALLRYLAMSCNIESLPRSISRLWNMQILILITTSGTLTVQEDIWEMYQLRHLRTNASALLPSPRFNAPDSRENVQSLSMISPESCTERVFARTPNIKKLGVRGNLALLFENNFKHFGNLQELTNLKLLNDDLSPENRVERLPSPYMFPKRLQKLTITGTYLDWEQMEILGSLEELEVLKLKDYAFKGKFWQPREGGFLSLKNLFIGRTDLVIWSASSLHFPRLVRLILRHCDELAEVPSSFADIDSFGVLELYHTNKNAVASARKIMQRKMPNEGQSTKTNGGFKLSVYPPIADLHT